MNRIKLINKLERKLYTLAKSLKHTYNSKTLAKWERTEKEIEIQKAYLLLN